MDGSVLNNLVPDFIETFTQRYVNPASPVGLQILDPAQTWTLRKVLSSMVHIETTRGGEE